MCYLLKDSTNLEDSNAVAVKNGSGTVGHVLFNLAAVVSAFFRRCANKG